MFHVRMDETGVWLLFKRIERYAIVVSFGIPLMDNLVKDFFPAERRKEGVHLTVTLNDDRTRDL